MSPHPQQGPPGQGGPPQGQGGPPPGQGGPPGQMMNMYNQPGGHGPGQHPGMMSHSPHPPHPGMMSQSPRPGN